MSSSPPTWRDDRTVSPLPFFVGIIALLLFTWLWIDINYVWHFLTPLNGPPPTNELLRTRPVTAVVLGVSPDGADKHQKFRAKYTLPFSLLSDPDKKVMSKFGAWGEKTLYGKKSMGIIRSTFLIDKAGVVRKVWPKVKVDGHDEAVLAALKELG